MYFEKRQNFFRDSRSGSPTKKAFATFPKISTVRHDSFTTGTSQGLKRGHRRRWQAGASFRALRCDIYLSRVISPSLAPITLCGCFSTRLATSNAWATTKLAFCAKKQISAVENALGLLDCFPWKSPSRFRHPSLHKTHAEFCIIGGTKFFRNLSPRSFSAQKIKFSFHMSLRKKNLPLLYKS